MRLTKKFSRGLSALALTGLLLAGAATAQPGPGPGPGGPEGRHSPMTHLSERLSLNADQQTQIGAIFARHFAEGKARRQAFEASMTPEQKAERDARFQELQANRQGNGEHRANPGRPPMGNLSQDQRQAFHQQMQAERQAIEAEIQAVLTPEQRVVFEQMKNDRPAHQRGRGNHGSSNG